TGTTTSLSVLGADDGGEANLSYTWSVVTKPAGAVNPTFSSNGTNAAKNTTATFTLVGAYTFLVTIKDIQGLTKTSSVNVMVQSLTNTAPTLVTAVAASPALVRGTTTALSVLGADDGGEANLTYTWSVLNKPPGAVTPTF